MISVTQIDPLYFVLGIVILIYIYQEWDRVMEFFTKTVLWKTYKPINTYAIYLGEFKQIKSTSLVENKEIRVKKSIVANKIDDPNRTDEGLISVMTEGEIIFTDDIKIVVPLSRVKSASWGALFGGRNDPKVFIIEPEFTEEMRKLEVDRLRKIIETQRKDYEKFGKAAFDTVKEAAKDLGEIGEKIKPTVVITGQSKSQFSQQQNTGE